jgi:hypothetical protein
MKLMIKAAFGVIIVLAAIVLLSSSNALAGPNWKVTVINKTPHVIVVSVCRIEGIYCKEHIHERVILPERTEVFETGAKCPCCVTGWIPEHHTDIKHYPGKMFVYSSWGFHIKSINLGTGKNHTLKDKYGKMKCKGTAACWNSVVFVKRVKGKASVKRKKNKVVGVRDYDFAFKKN